MATMYAATDGRTYALNAFFDKYADIGVDYPIKEMFGQTLLHMVRARVRVRARARVIGPWLG